MGLWKAWEPRVLGPIHLLRPSLFSFGPTYDFRGSTVIKLFISHPESQKSFWDLSWRLMDAERKGLFFHDLPEPTR